MQTYLDLVSRVLKKGIEKEDRTGVGTLSLFGVHVSHDLRKGFPLVTTKKIHFKSLVHELLWCLRGETNVRSLNAQGVHIWDPWADEKGDLGPIYGKQWRSWPNGKHGVDQISQIIQDIKLKPDSRRLIVSSWNVVQIPEMALPCCHVLFQFYVANRRLSCQIYQRSADLFIGVPFNIASYALLTQMVAHVCGLECGDLYHCFGDLHLYRSHVQVAKLQLKRKPRVLPRLVLETTVRDIFAFSYDDINISGYDPHPHISAEVAV